MASDEPLFLARRSYRRRRTGDAAYLIPVIGLVLMLLPILWPAGYRTSGAMIYIFLLWGVLILGMGFLSRILARGRPDGDEVGDPDTDRR